MEKKNKKIIVFTLLKMFEIGLIVGGLFLCYFVGDLVAKYSDPDCGDNGCGFIDKIFLGLITIFLGGLSLIFLIWGMVTLLQKNWELADDIVDEKW